MRLALLSVGSLAASLVRSPSGFDPHNVLFIAALLNVNAGLKHFFITWSYRP